MSPTPCTAILGGLRIVCHFHGKSYSSNRSLGELYKYGQCFAAEPLAVLSGHTAAWLNVIIVMQQWVFLRKLKSSSKPRNPSPAAVEANPLTNTQWTPLDSRLYFPQRAPAGHRCVPGYQHTASLWPNAGKLLWFWSICSNTTYSPYITTFTISNWGRGHQLRNCHWQRLCVKVLKSKE